MMKGMRKPIALLLTLSLLSFGLAGCKSRERPDARPETQTPEQEEMELGIEVADTSFETVTGHIDLQVPEELIITRPAEDLEYAGDYYYLTGSSDPNLPLTLNGDAVLHRGIYGSFGVYAELEEGENVFTFAQGDVTSTVTITKIEAPAPLTNILTQMYPTVDSALRSGDEYTIRCTAPAGSSVSAEIQGVTIALEQSGESELSGAPVTYTGTFVPLETEGTQKVGSVRYTLDWNGETKDHFSSGSLYVTGSGYDLVVRATEVSASTFETEATEDDYMTTLKEGAVDVVVEIGANRYRLGMGGWVNQSLVQPLTGTDNVYQNQVSDTRLQSGEDYDILTFTGTAPAPYTAAYTEDGLQLTFYHTSGISGIDFSGSNLFSDILVTQEGGNTILRFVEASPGILSGYLVEYNGADTVLTLTMAPRLEGGDLPLKGLTILLDPGHGGGDEGSSGVPLGDGPKEKEITLQTTLAVGKYLKGLGATVLMTRLEDEPLDLNQRLSMTQNREVDLMLSLHCNSIPNNYDGTGANGVEVFYYDPISQTLAENLLSTICQNTGRRMREVNHAYYKVTLSSNAPSVLVEMGFLTNPLEYDRLIDKGEIYTVAESIGEAILKTYGLDPVQPAAATEIDLDASPEE